MYIVFLIILAVIFALVPILDAFVFGKKEPRNMPTTATDKEKIKCKSYYSTIAYLWCLALPVVFMCIIGGINPANIGFRGITFTQSIWLTVTILVAAFALFVYEFVYPMVSPKYRNSVMQEPDAVDEYPQTTKEKWLYSLQTLSSAICEESVYRGFLFFLLITVFPGMSIYLILLITFVSFGMGHLYQGWSGVIETGLFGALSMGLIIVTGSLTPSILLHFFGDFAPAFMVRKRIV